MDTLVLDTVVQSRYEGYAVQMIDYSDCMMVGDQAQESREGAVSKHDTRARDSVDLEAERGDEQSGRALVQSGGGRQSQQGARL